MTKIVKTKTALIDLVSSLKQEGKSIGFIPTMGALHQGHLHLMQEAKSQNDVVICSIFVNPIQFNNATDLEHYPRNTEKDIAFIDGVCDICFLPTVEEMYPEPPKESYHFGSLETVMEGRYRPGHFNGVAIVVKRLLKMVQADRAYFGRKDFQQLTIIQKLVEQEQIATKIVPVDIVRAADGLALSSRNNLLSQSAREKVPFIYKTLLGAKQKKGILSVLDLREWIKKEFEKETDFQLEYAEIVNAKTLQPIENYSQASSVIICIAAWLDKVRLIDNIFIQ